MFINLLTHDNFIAARFPTTINTVYNKHINYTSESELTQEQLRV